MTMLEIGTPGKANAVRVLLLGAGELGKEVAIEAQRLGLEVIAADRYAGAPAMQVAHRAHVVDMLSARALRRLIEQEQPQFIVPEVEAIATEVLEELESAAHRVVPVARATRLCMDREGIRRLAAEELGLPTSPYRFAGNAQEYQDAIQEIGFPCVVKPVMSSSGKGQTTVHDAAAVSAAWDYAKAGARGRSDSVIVEGFVDFDYEITLLTVRHSGGMSFCAPIGHLQVDGDYRESWQPQDMSAAALLESQRVARVVTDALGGFGIFGVELFIKGDEVYFSEVSPRPHDTGMVTLISQDLTEFALHVRAFLGLPVPSIRQFGPAASCVIIGKGECQNIAYAGLNDALREADTALRLFGKPDIAGHRRLGVCLALDDDIETARAKARRAAAAVKVRLNAN